MDLVETLRAQHRLVEAVGGRLTEALKAGDLATAQVALRELRQALLAHLELEDQELYPKLIARARASDRSNEGLVAQTFSDNMLRISAGLRAFLDRHAAPRDLEGLSRDWQHISGILSQRIQSEEQVLYPLFARVTAVDGSAEA
jgi:iron-sulfur cluster repair protein YtfE (RIC family)